jgi:hypothetical protein
VRSSRARGRGAGVRLGLVGLLAAVALVACGEEQTFTAEEMVSEVNEHGAGVRLGEALTTSQEDLELYAIRLSGAGDAGQVPGTDQGSPPVDVHAAGSVTITESDDEGVAEYERCESAASLICFRAANAVLILEDTVPNQDLARIEAAIRAIGEG